MEAFIGEIAGLATACMYSLSSTFFSLAGRKVSSISMNRARLVIACAFLIIAHFILRIPLPFSIERQQLFWLSLSALIGLVFGDLCLYEGYARIGPRLTMLLLSLAPVLSVFLAAIFLSERLTAVQTAGILITVGGIAWVVSDRNGNGSAGVVNKKTFSTGIVFGLGAAVAQAVGLIASKRGLTGDLSSLSANLVRMTAAMIILWTYTLLRGQAGNTLTEISRANRSALFILLGSIAGPFFGVTFSMIALQNTQVGIASTLIALPPVLMLPIGYFAFHEHFGWRAVLGTLVAMGGVALLFLV